MKRFTLFYRLVGCNQRCKHCYIPSNANKKMKTINEIKNVIDQLAEINNKKLIQGNNSSLYFHDEPTIHPKILDILDYMIKQNVKYNFTLATNGYGLIRKKMV